MDRWKYRIVSWTEQLPDEAFEADLNGEGEKGFEAVAMATGPDGTIYVLMKRRTD